MVESTEYDSALFSHSLFGDYTFARERDFQTFVSTNELPYDCFWDELGDVKHFFEDQTGGFVGNDVFAVMPNGTMFKYDILSGEDFEDWIHQMYNTAYPSKK